MWWLGVTEECTDTKVSICNNLYQLTPTPTFNYYNRISNNGDDEDEITVVMSKDKSFDRPTITTVSTKDSPIKSQPAPTNQLNDDSFPTGHKAWENLIVIKTLDQAQNAETMFSTL